VTVLKALKRVEKSLDEVVEMKDLDEKRLPLEAEGQAFSQNPDGFTQELEWTVKVSAAEDQTQGIWIQNGSVSTPL
jgi:hypothetical protein